MEIFLLENTIKIHSKFHNGNHQQLKQYVTHKLKF